MAYAQVGNRRIYYSIEGVGDRVMVLASSLGATTEMWNEQAADLSSDYRVLRFDARGHGRSDPDGSVADISHLAADALAVMDAVGADKVDFVGLSLGGMIGQWLAVHRPERLRSLTLCATGASLGPAQVWETRAAAACESGLSTMVDASRSRWFTGRFLSENPKRVEELLDALRDVDASSYAACCRVIRDFDMSDEIHKISVPTLLIAGANDPATPVGKLEEIQARLPGAELVVVPEAAHILNVEQPTVVTAAIRRFMESTAVSA